MPFWFHAMCAKPKSVPAVQVEFDRPHALGKTGGVLGFVKHPTAGQHQDDALFAIRHRVADRLAVRPNEAGLDGPRCGQKTLSCWHQYPDECPPDETEVRAVSMACRTTVVSHR